MKTTSNKRIRVIAIIAATVMASTLGAQFAEAAPVRYISISSVGTVKVVPDAVRLNASVSALSKVSKDALATAEYNFDCLSRI